MDVIPEGDDELIAQLREVDTANLRWIQDAACASEDPNIFFPGRGERMFLAQARAICNTCPVWRECLLAALSGPDRGGVRAGTIEKRRRVLRKLFYGG